MSTTPQCKHSSIRSGIPQQLAGSPRTRLKACQTDKADLWGQKETQSLLAFCELGLECSHGSLDPAQLLALSLNGLFPFGQFSLKGRDLAFSLLEVAPRALEIGAQAFGRTGEEDSDLLRAG